MTSNPYQCNSVPEYAECKVCRGQALLAGLVDFYKGPTDPSQGRNTNSYEGLPVYYHACLNCGLAFTRAFDHWTVEDFSKHVYNASYYLRDPDYFERRPRIKALMILENFAAARSQTRVLDYGSGTGLLAEILKSSGFAEADGFDPFSAPERPQGRYEMVTCFEVFEHTTQPDELLADIKSYLTPDGAVLFSTELCSPAILEQGLSHWWYCAPRSGHVTFYSAESLRVLGRRHGLHFASLDNANHIFYQERPAAWLPARLRQTLATI